MKAMTILLVNNDRNYDSDYDYDRQNDYLNDYLLQQYNRYMHITFHTVCLKDL